MPHLQEKLRSTFIQAYFAPEIQPKIYEQSQINRLADEYSKTLMETSEPPLQLETGQTDETASIARNQGFRKTITTLYEHRCALCGIRMLTPDGHTVVEAAHIVPWRESKDDKPTNGMALCRLCHWSFDEGLMSVGKEYEVLISKQVKREPNFPGHMLTLSDRPIFRPNKSDFWPAPDKIEWHRKKVLKK